MTGGNCPQTVGCGCPNRTLAKLFPATQRRTPSQPFMKTKLPLVASVAILLVTTGCATRNTSSGGKETSVLGGAITVTSDSFQPVNPATINADTSKIVGKNGPSGRKISLLWGTLTLNDY